MVGLSPQILHLATIEFFLFIAVTSSQLDRKYSGLAPVVFRFPAYVMQLFLKCPWRFAAER